MFCNKNVIVKLSTRYKCLLLLTSIMLISSPLLFAQGPDTLWSNTYGGNSVDVGSSVQQTEEGGYIIAGFTWSYGAGNYDVWLIKTNSSGGEQWNNTYGGDSSDRAYSVQQTTDDGYIIAGYTASQGAGNEDVWLIKTDASGNSPWSSTFGGADEDLAYSVQQTTDGGYIITGYTFSYGAGNSDLWLIKTDSSGDSLWTKTFGGSYGDYGYGILQTADGGYIIVGQTYSAGSNDVWLMKTDSSGDSIWAKTFGDGGYDSGYALDIADDGGYILTGYTETCGGNSDDVWLIKTDSLGNSIWTTSFGGGQFDYGNSVKQTEDGGYIITGYTASYGGGSGDLWLIKTDSSGDTMWTKALGDYRTDEGFSVQQTSDYGYVIVGKTLSFGSGNSDVWLIKTEPDIGIEEEMGEFFKTSCRIYPNPTSDKINLSFHLSKESSVAINVYDISGSLVAKILNRKHTRGQFRETWRFRNLPAGVYFVEFRTDDYREQQKVILLK